MLLVCQLIPGLNLRRHKGSWPDRQGEAEGEVGGKAIQGCGYEWIDHFGSKGKHAGQVDFTRMHTLLLGVLRPRVGIKCMQHMQHTEGR